MVIDVSGPASAGRASPFLTGDHGAVPPDRRTVACAWGAVAVLGAAARPEPVIMVGPATGASILGHPFTSGCGAR